MRKEFFRLLLDLMEKDDRIVCLAGDLGWGGFNAIEEKYPERFINCGASEQAMMSIAVGLALNGKRPIVYSITPFLIYRPFETIRTYLDHESIPVLLVGSGRDRDYSHDGYSHDASDVSGILDLLPNVVKYYPTDEKDLPNILIEALSNTRPSFLSLRR